MFVRLVFNLHLNRCCLWLLTDLLKHRSPQDISSMSASQIYIWNSSLTGGRCMWRTESASPFLTSKAHSLRLQRLISTRLKSARRPSPFDFTSITPNRGYQRCLNYVMLDLDLRPEMLSSQLPKCTLEPFIINNVNYSSIANCFSMETLQIFSH